MTRRLLMCEGPDDVAFFKAFIKARSLGRLGFRIIHTGLKKGSPGGYTRFRDGLEGLAVPLGRKVYQEFRDILLVGDNDEVPGERFENIKGQAQSALKIAPDAPRQFAVRKDVNCRVKILMIPWDSQIGNLETLCFIPARDSDSVIRPKVDQFRSHVLADKWQECRSQEMWLRSYLAAKCQENPFVSMQDVFDKFYDDDLIPLNSKHFDHIYNELLTFDA